MPSRLRSNVTPARTWMEEACAPGANCTVLIDVLAETNMVVGPLAVKMAASVGTTAGDQLASMSQKAPGPAQVAVAAMLVPPQPRPARPAYAPTYTPAAPAGVLRNHRKRRQSSPHPS